MQGSNDLKQFAMLMLMIFVIGIVTGVSYLGFNYLKSSICTQDSATHVWAGGVCQVSSANTTAVTITANTKVAIVEGVLDVALGLLTLVVLIGIFKLVIKTAKGFGNFG